MRVLLVKLSSLGDVVHAMPVVHDIRAAHPGAVVDWVVEPAFAPLVRRVDGIGTVFECAERRWRRGWWTASVRSEFKAFRRQLQQHRYDAVIDLQGLTKSAVVAWLANGTHYALANRTDGSGYEAPTRWLADVAIHVPSRMHALDRSRELAAESLGHRAMGSPVFALKAAAPTLASPTIAFVHGTSRDDKLWPEDHWIQLGRRAVSSGHAVALPHAGLAERERAERIARAIGPQATVWPAMGLDHLVDHLAATHGVIGVDSGLSHIAVALDLPHVQLYNFPTSWRTGPQVSHGHRHQVSLERDPTPEVDLVWATWQVVRRVGRT